MRLIFDRTLRTVTEKLPQVYADAHRARTIVVTGPLVEKSKRAILENQGVTAWTLPAKNEAAWFAELRQKCGEAGLNGLLIEGGPKLLSAFLQAGELDYLFAYRAPKFLADAEAAPVFTGPPRPRLADAFTLKDARQASLGDDQLLRGFVAYPGTQN